MTLIVPAKIVKSNRKSVALAINEKGELIVRAPHRITSQEISRILEQRREWILKNQQQMSQRLGRKRSIEPENGTLIPFCGKEYIIRLGAYGGIEIRNDELLLPNSPERKKLLIAWLKKQARLAFEKSADNYSRVMGLKYSAIKLSNAKTRWGTCNVHNVIRFSWRLVMCPQAVLDYVVVHELCHIRHRNHGKGFWEDVERIDPYYKEKRKWLREHAEIIHYFES